MESGVGSARRRERIPAESADDEAWLLVVRADACHFETRGAINRRCKVNAHCRKSSSSLETLIYSATLTCRADIGLHIFRATASVVVLFSSSTLMSCARNKSEDPHAIKELVCLGFAVSCVFGCFANQWAQAPTSHGRSSEPTGAMRHSEF